MMQTTKTIEGRVLYNIEVLRDIIALTNEDPNSTDVSIMHKIGDLKLDRDGEYLLLTYVGREDIARRLEFYIAKLNYYGSHKAMMAAFEFTEGRK